MATGDEVEERRRHAEQLVGQRIAAVRYYELDHRREELHPDLLDRGPRLVTDDVEWEDPTWRYAGFDAVDLGVELETESGAVFSLAWDPPGDQEGIGLRNAAMLGNYVVEDGDVAIWSVGDRTGTWTPVIEAPIAGVRLHYRPWQDGFPGFWCPHITFHAADTSLHVVLGDADSGALAPSANNIAVLHSTTLPPEWVTR